MHIAAGSGTTSKVTIEGEEYFRQTIVDPSPRPARFTSACFVKAETGKLALRPPTGSIRRILRNGMEANYGTADVIVEPSDGWVYFEMQIKRASLSYDQNDLALTMVMGSAGFFALPKVIAGWVTIGDKVAVLPNDRLFQS